MRTWLTLWLCLCLLLSSPVHGDCCLRVAADGAGQDVAAAVADAATPPCHRQHAATAAPARTTDPSTPAPADDPSGCEHCSCPCRIAAMPALMALPSPLPPPAFAPAPMPRRVVAGAHIPPLPPPIA